MRRTGLGEAGEEERINKAQIVGTVLEKDGKPTVFVLFCNGFLV